MNIDDDTFYDFIQNGKFTVLIDGETPSYYDDFPLPYTIKLTANDGFIFTKAQGSDYDPSEGGFPEFVINPPNVATKTFYNSTGEFNYKEWDFVTEESGVEPEPEPEPEPPKYDFKVTQSYINELAAKKVTLYINNILAVDGQTYKFPYDVKLIVAPTHYATQYYGGDYDPVEGDYERLKASNDFRTLTGTMTRYNIDTFTIQTEVDESVIPPNKIAYNDIFILTPEQARIIATTDFIYNIGGSDSPQGKNVISFLKLPFKIPEDLVLGVKGVKIGLVSADFDAEYIDVDLYSLDMGKITVPDDKQNLLSFENTTAILHLPYSNPINLDIEYVIGQTINIVYEINLYDGIANVNISSSKIGGVIDTKNIKLNINIPFGKPDDNPSNNMPDNIDFGINNGVLNPYIEILRNDAVLADGFFTIPIVDESLLSDQKGFIKVDEIDLNSKASRDEKEMILTAINQGVIIK